MLKFHKMARNGWISREKKRWPTVSVAANRRKKPRRPEPDGVLIGGSTDRMGDDPDKKRKRCGKGSDGRGLGPFWLAARAGPSGQAFAAIEVGKLAGWADWARDRFLRGHRRQFLPLDECRLVIGLSHRVLLPFEGLRVVACRLIVKRAGGAASVRVRKRFSTALNSCPLASTASSTPSRARRAWSAAAAGRGRSGPYPPAPCRPCA